jgi:hypothetical protein
MFWQFFIWLIPTLSAVELIYLLYLLSIPPCWRDCWIRLRILNCAGS